MEEQKELFAKGFRAGVQPRMVGTYLIDEAHSNRHARLLHMHGDSLELLFVYSGEGQYMVDGCSYQVRQGDMIICNARVLHGEEPSKQRRMRTYSIALRDVFVEGLPENSLMDERIDPVLSCSILSDQIGHMMRMIYVLHSRQGNLERVCSYTAMAVLLLVHDLLLSRERNGGGSPRLPANMLARRIQHYLDDHYTEALTLHSIGSALRISEYYLAHVFKAEMGMPPIQYVMKRRMGEAQTLLIDTNLPVAEISERLGYGNPWNFSSAFSRCVGVSPSQYRRTFRVMSYSQLQG